MKIRAVLVKPNEEPKVVEIEDELFELQNIVDGYIEQVAVEDEIVAIVNEEGKLLGMTPNFYIGYQLIVGPALFVRDTGDIGYLSLTEEEIAIVKNIVEEGRGL